MQHKPALVISGLVIVIMFAVSAWAWGQIPDGRQIPVHFGLNGTPNRYGGKVQGLLVLPLIASGLTGLLAFLPRIEPRAQNLARSGKAYSLVWIAAILLLSGIHFSIVAIAIGRTVNMAVIINALLGVFFLVTGNYLGKIRRNFVFGIRTPWTLDSDLAWNKTHRLGGWLFVLLGSALLLSALDGGAKFSRLLLLGGTGTIILILIVYSYLVWKNDPAKQG